MAEIGQQRGFGLYVHWPFCTSKCPYCDFNSHVSARVDQTRWLRAFELEISRYAARTGPRVLNSIFFGGGTPSLMQPDTVDGILRAARSAWPFANDIEITLEANPGSVEAGRFAGYRDAGVNRISMGVQALNDTDLRRLGRLHSVAEARAAFDIARRCFDRVSFDLIYARQNQTLSEWRAELSEALSMAVDHLSLYQLTIEDGTAFGDRFDRGRLPGLPDEERSATMYEVTQEICDKAGLPAYEVSNHARPGAESRHNLIYWQCGDYVGIGPGAHGRITLDGRRHATEAPKSPGLWLAAAEAGKLADDQGPISPEDQGAEYLMMGLRLKKPLYIDRYAEISGRPLTPERLDTLAEMDLLNLDGTQLSVTPKGRLLLNTVLAEILRD